MLAATIAMTLALAAASCSSGNKTGGGSAPTEPTTATAGTIPPADNGTLLSTEQIPAPQLHGTLVRVTYASQSLSGHTIAVSGLIAYPTSPAPAEGRPIITWAHGTTGLADQCAPSHDPSAVSGLASVANVLLDRGIVIAATDYEGLGTPGLHPYLVGESEGRSVLDIARAALRLPDAHARPDVIIWGHSQGGHAALFAQQIASRWSPELKILGALAAAPAAELPALEHALEKTPYYPLILMVAAAYDDTYPELDVGDVLTDEALDRLTVVEDDCADGVALKFLDLPASKVVKTDPMSVPAWAARINENTPGTVRTDTPLFIYQGTSDEVIPVTTSELLAARLCALGQTVERRVYEGQGHSGVLVVAFPDALQWIDDRLAAKPATSTCMPS